MSASRVLFAKMVTELRTGKGMGQIRGLERDWSEKSIWEGIMILILG